MMVKLGILVVSIALLVFVPRAQAQELELSAVPEVSPTKAPSSYKLPYPGVLPGHFLYTLKDFRDTIISFMISHPIRQTHFAILQADKRYEAGYQLLLKDKEKKDVSEKTIRKAQDYFDDALEKAGDAKRQGIDIHDVTRVLIESQAKHQEVLQATIQEAGSGGEEQFSDEMKREVEFSKRVKQLNP